jgi:hypothetical protein
MNQKTINTAVNINEILSFFSRVYKFVLIFGTLGFVVGCILFYDFSEKNLEYTVKGEFESHATNGETVSDVLSSINYMDDKTKSKALHIPYKTATNLLKIVSNSKVIMKSPENPFFKSYIEFELRYSNKFEINRIIKGLNYYLNHNKYLLKELILYKKKREIKRELLKNIDLEINNIYRLNQENKGIRGFSYKSNADLYKLKLDINFDLLNPNSIIRIVNITEPKLKSIISSKYILILISTLIGALLGLFVIQIRNSLISNNK